MFNPVPWPEPTAHERHPMQLLGHATQALLLAPFIAGAVMGLMPNPERTK